jgi:glutamate 5-kinase
MEVMLSEEVIPIVNENDTLSITELMFTDNDELSGLMAEMMKVDMLIILSNIDGIYDGNPSLPGSKVIRSIKLDHDEDDLIQYIQSEKSSLGRGGMQTKCHIACSVAKKGIPVIIANGKNENILLHLIDRPSETICTLFHSNK